MALLLVALASAIAPATCSAGPQDVASTQAYLQAAYQADLAYMAQVPQVQSAADEFVTNIKIECPGALRGVEASLHQETSSMRVFGEQALHQEQLSILEEELKVGGESALFSPDRQAFLTFEDTVAALTWNDVALKTAITDSLQDEHARRFDTPPAVCSDIDSWLAGGSRLLSAGTKAFLAIQEGQQQQLEDERAIAIGPALEHFETSEGRRLAARIERIGAQYDNDLSAAYQALEGARDAVGLKPEFGPRLRREMAEIEHSTRLGKGRTAAGGQFQVRVVKGSGHCVFRIEVQDTKGSPFSKEAMCASDVHGTVQRERCEEGERIVEAVMPTDVRKVALHLAGGRVVVSKTLTLPAKLGGPAAFYYQAAPRGAHVPVSMTELGSDGQMLATVAVGAVAKCIRRGLHSVSGGSHPLAHGQIPGGPGFTIRGDAFAYNGPPSLSLSVELEGRGGGGSNLSGASPHVFVLTTHGGCYPTYYEIVYGLLKAPADTVQAHASGNVTTLQRAELPVSLHTRGVLVYGVFTTPVESIVVETPGGRTVVAEGLSERTIGQMEYCEGFIEPGREPREEASLF